MKPNQRPKTICSVEENGAVRLCTGGVYTYDYRSGVIDQDGVHLHCAKTDTDLFLDWSSDYDYVRYPDSFDLTVFDPFNAAANWVAFGVAP